MENYYEINVTHSDKKTGEGFGHLFATAPRSCRTEKEARKVFKEIKKRFPKTEGFNVIVNFWSASGKYLSW